MRRSQPLPAPTAGVNSVVKTVLKQYKGKALTKLTASEQLEILVVLGMKMGIVDKNGNIIAD